MKEQLTPYQMRKLLEKHFSVETAYPSIKSHPDYFQYGRSLPRSTGHCAAVALICHYYYYDCQMMSTNELGESHWFNLIEYVSKDGKDWLLRTSKDRNTTFNWRKDFHFDLTGDQFGFPPYQMNDKLYCITKQRYSFSMGRETFLRAQKLATKAGLTEILETIKYNTPA
jgi:hypothetical protein